MDNIKENKYLCNSMRKLGKVIVDENKIFCYVNEMKVNNKSIISCEGSTNNKDIYYIFNNILFKKNIIVSGENCHIIFENCNFSEKLEFSYCSDVTLRNNRYVRNSAWPSSFLTCKIDNLTVEDDNLTNSSIYGSCSPFKLFINTKNFNINNSKIDTKNMNGEINISTDTLNINNSTVESEKINIDACNINSNESTLKSNHSININNKECNCNIDVIAPSVNYNGVEVHNKTINQREKELADKRQELTNVLRNLRTTCEEEIKKELRNKTITKILKK